MADSILHILPFGPPAWTRRKEIIAGIISARPGPPWDFRDVLYLVPNERTVKSIRILFLEALKEETGASGCIPPLITALNRFANSRIDTANFISPLARKLLLEEICQGLHAKLPGLHNEYLARSLSRQISDALERAYLHKSAGRLDRIQNDSVPFLALALAKKEYERRLMKLGLVDPAAAMAGWESNDADFQGYKTVILDGFYDALPYELHLMKALQKGRSFHFIVEAPGLQEAMIEPGMPYAGTQQLISELFPETEIKSGEAADADADLLSGALFLGRPIRETLKFLEATGPGPVDRGRAIKLISAQSPKDEVDYIARTIKEEAMSGRLQLDKTLVLFPEPEFYLHALKEVFADFGIPYSLTEKKPLLSNPVSQAFLDLLSIPSEDYPFRLMRRAFYSPFLSLGEADSHAMEFDGFARKHGITGGRGRWEALAHEKECPFSNKLNRLLDLLKPLEAREMHPSDWAQRVLEVFSSAGIKENASKSGADGPALAADALKGGLAGLRHAVRGLSGKITLPRFIGMLKTALSDIRLGRKAGDFSGVRVLGRLEAFSEGFDTVFIAGVIEGSIPSFSHRELILPTGSLSGSPADDKKTRDSRLFLGLILGARSVCLSYPKEYAGKAATASPWIMALKPFVIAGAAEEIRDYCRPIAPEGMGASSPEAHYSQGYVNRIDNFTLKMTSSEDIPTPSPVLQRKLSVTELEDYIKCGYRYYHRWVLKDLPPEEPDDDAGPDVAGRAVHNILARFYARLKTPVRREDIDEAKNALSKLLIEEFREIPDTLMNRETKRKFIERFAPRVLAADAELPPDTLIEEVEMKVGGELSISDTETVIVTGKIDRLELCGNGSFAVVDYKTGRYPGNGGIPLKDNFQLPLYAYLLRKYLPEKRASAFVFYNLGRTGQVRDVVCYDRSLHTGEAINSKERRREDSARMTEYIDEVAQKAKNAAKGIISGQFPKATDAKQCMYCEVADACTGPDEEDDES